MVIRRDNKMTKAAKDKQNDFERLAVKRVNKLIKDARLIANLGNKNIYEGSQEKKQSIINCCFVEVKNIEKALTTGNVQVEGFQF